MKKLIGAIIIIALLSAGICLGVLFTAKSKSKILLAEYLRGIDNWSVESAYFNPFTHSLKIKGFTIALASGIEFSIKSMLLSDFKQIEDTISCSASLEEILFVASPASVNSSDLPNDIATKDLFKITADSFSATVLLDREKLDKFIETPGSKFNPLKNFNGLELRNSALSFGERKFVSLESMTGDGYRIGLMLRLTPDEDNKSINLSLMGSSFYPADSISMFNNLVIYADKEYLIERITGTTAYKDGVYTKKVNIDSSDLFLLDVSYNIAPIEAEEERDAINMPDVPAWFQELINGLDTTMLYGFEIYYTDRSFANIVLDRYLATRNLRREAVIDLAETLAKNNNYAKALFNGAAAFLREPETMIIKAKPVKPASIYHFINNIYELGLSVSFNGSDEFLVQKTPGKK